MPLFGRYEKIRCPDGRTVLVLKDPSDAFPIIAPEWEARINVAKGILRDQIASGVDIRKKLKKLYGELDRINIDLRAHYSATYLAFCSDPCNIEASNRLWEANGKIMKLTNELRKIELEIEEYVKSPQEKTYFCVKCKKKVEIRDSKSVTLKNNRPAVKGTCPICGKTVFGIGHKHGIDYKVKRLNKIEDLVLKLSKRVPSKRRLS